MINQSANVEASKDDFQETNIELLVFGRTRFKYQRVTGMQGKYRYRFWRAVEAVKVVKNKMLSEGWA